jgi:hypothetical protein
MYCSFARIYALVFILHQRFVVNRVAGGFYGVHQLLEVFQLERIARGLKPLWGVLRVTAVFQYLGLCISFCLRF